MRKDLREIRQDRKQLKQDIKTGNGRGQAQVAAEIKQDKKDINQDAQKFKQEGVKHPINRAHHQIKKHR